MKMKTCALLLIPLMLLALSTVDTAAQEVEVRIEMISLPTYTMGPDEKLPILRGFKVPGVKVFRAERTTYPYPQADNFRLEKKIQEYEAAILENEYNVHKIT
jgi:hypothetical protein